MTPDIDVRRGDVLSAWAGIRPLVRDPAAGDTASLVRNHVVHIRFGLSSFCLVCCVQLLPRVLCPASACLEIRSSAM